MGRRLTICAATVGAAATMAMTENEELPSVHQRLIEALFALESHDSTVQARALAIVEAAAPQPLATNIDPVAATAEAYGVPLPEGPVSRGHLRGPLMRTATFPGTSEAFALVFAGGQTARVTLKTGGNLTLSIRHDEDTICRSAPKAGVAHCRWTPRFSQSYTLHVEGAEGARTRYTLLVN